MKEQIENIIEQLKELDIADTKGLESFYIDRAIEQLQIAIKETAHKETNEKQRN